MRGGRGNTEGFFAPDTIDKSSAAVTTYTIVSMKTRIEISSLSHRHHHGHISGPSGAVA
jgi:hypothetical protein